MYEPLLVVIVLFLAAVFFPLLWADAAYLMVFAVATFGFLVLFMALWGLWMLWS